MTENKILIYAGTTEGRQLAEFLVKGKSVFMSAWQQNMESLFARGK